MNILDKIKNMLIPKLAGISYAEWDVVEAPAQPIPSNFVEKSLDQHEPALAEIETQIKSYRKSDYFQEYQVLPRYVAENLQAHDKAVGQAVVAKETSRAARQVQAIQSEYSDVPVLSAKQKTKAVSDEEMRRRDREREGPADICESFP